MSVLGIDLGTHSSTISVVRAGTIDIVLNEASNRKTPSVVGFGEKQREIGESGYTSYARNAHNTIAGFKRLLGRQFNDPALQKEIQRYGGAKWVELPDKGLGAEVRSSGQRHTFSAQQITAMYLAKLKQISQDYLKQPMADVVISVPGYWTDSQRMALLDAAKIAGMAPLQLFNSLTAVAFFYGFYKPEITDENARKVMFIDCGSSDFSVNVCEFSKNKCAVLASAYEPNFGGYNIDEILADHFAANFLKKTKLDLKSNKKAYLRVMQAVERVKKTLNENPSAGISVECLMEDRDLSDSITREDYLKLIAASGAQAKILAPIQKVLQDAGVKKEDLHSIEWVGSGMRAVPLQQAISEFLGRQLSNTLNAEEATAKGCALRCAFLSPGRKTRPYDLVDKLNHSVTLAWKSLGDPSDTKEVTAILFPQGQAYGKSKYITFPRKDAKPFELYTRYTEPETIPVVDTAPIFASAKVPVINKEADSNGSRDANIRVRIRLDAHGIVRIGEAELVEEKDVTVEVPIEEPKKDETKKEEPKKEAEKKDEEKKEPEKKEGEPMDTTTDAPAPASPATEKKDSEGDVPMKDAAPKTRKETRRKTFYTAVGIQTLYNSISADILDKYTKLELELERKDADSVARAHAKNTVETTVYRSREKLADTWAKFTTAEESSKLTELLQNVENWLYEDGDDETKEVYDKKLAEITALTNPLASRAFEWDAVPPALAALQQAIQQFKGAATSGDEKYAHLSKEDLAKVVKECDDAYNSIQPKLELFSKRTQTSDPVFFSVDLIERAKNLTNICNPILSKPKPAPAPTPAPQPAAGTAPEKPAADKPAADKPAAENAPEKMDTESTAAGTAGTPPPAEKMDTSV